jgi:uncharacterized protein
MIAVVSDYRRRILDDELDVYLGGLPAIAIEGVKAVGKTATASQRATTVYSLDDPTQRSIAEADLDRVVNSPPPVLIDEWQLLPPVWDKVRRAVDAHAAAGSYILTGSASPAGVGTHSGAGRIVSMRMRPLSFAERGLVEPTVSLAKLLKGTRPNVAGDTVVALAEYTHEVLRGGFPGLRDISEQLLRAQLDAYLSRIVDRDFPELGANIRNPTALRRWMAAYAAATSTTATFETILDAATAGLADRPAKSTVIAYRDVLERLFVVEALPGWQPTANRISKLGVHPKHHLADPALAARLVGATAAGLLRGEAPGPVIPRDGTYLGALFESLATLSVRVYAQAAECQVSHFRRRGGDREVDLIVERSDGRVIAIETKLSANVDDRDTRHLRWLGEKLGDQLLDMMIMTTGKSAYRDKEGVAVVPLALLGP